MSKTKLLKSEWLIPLAHVSGSKWFYGRVAVPVKVTWPAGPEGIPEKGGELAIDVRNDRALENALNSSILGRSLS
jgi:hypothetical protein